MLRIEQVRTASSTFFVMAGHRHPADGAVRRVTYERVRPHLVEIAPRRRRARSVSTAATTQLRTWRVLGDEKGRLEVLAGPLAGQRYHYLRVDPHANLAPSTRLGFRYDTSLGFADLPGFRAGIAHPFRPWNVEADRPLDLVEIPLAAMDVTLAEERYLGLSASSRPSGDCSSSSSGRLRTAVASPFSGTRTVSTPRRHAAGTAFIYRFVDAVRTHGGVCLQAGTLAEEADEWLP